MSRTWTPVLRGSPSWAGRSCGAGATRRDSAPLAPVRARSMCRGGQGGRGKGKNTSTFASFEDETQDKGCWMSWWVEDVDAVYEECVKQGVEVTWPPTDMPWNVREMHVRHPDGHVFRIGKGLKEE